MWCECPRIRRRPKQRTVPRDSWMTGSGDRGQARTRQLGWTVAVCCVFVMCVSQLSVVAGNVMGDECDWFGSGLSSEGRGVTPVYLRCGQGRVRWVYPRGALRVLLRLAASNREFRGCVKVAPDFAGARIFVEGPRSLSLLHSGDDHRPKLLPRCFHSRNGQVALYVEATKTITDADFTKQVAAFEYDLEPLPRDGSGFDPSEECRPCTSEEMARAYCTSDLVTRGIISSIENKEDLEVAEMTVKVTKLLRHSTEDSLAAFENGLFANSNNNHHNHLVHRLDNNNDIDYVVLDSSDANRLSDVTMYRPSHCGAKHGPGEYVFMARRKLGQLTLTCAPRLEEWAQIRTVINKDENAHCKLKS